MWVVIACFCLTLFAAYCLSKSSDIALQQSAGKFLRAFSDTDFSSLFDANEAGAVEGKSQPQRRTLTPLQKKRVAAANGWRCAKCGQLVDETFEIDHIVPLARFSDGTGDAENNLRVLCKRCHVLITSLQNSDRVVQLKQRRPNAKTIASSSSIFKVTSRDSS